jgi:hypothetical protein
VVEGGGEGGKETSRKHADTELEGAKKSSTLRRATGTGRGGGGGRRGRSRWGEEVR